MTVGTRTLPLVVAVLFVASAGSSERTNLHAQIVNPGTLVGFNPQPDPPGFGFVAMLPGQTIRLNVGCFDHHVGFAPPDPCRGLLRLTNGFGAGLAQRPYELRPGESTFLTFTRPAIDGDVTTRLSVQPYVLPGRGGRAVPSVEVFDTTGRVVIFGHPASARLSDFSNGLADPGSIVGFNPQPDPPGFGPLTVAVGQLVRLNVSCPAQGETPPDPCRGAVMFHNQAGDILARGVYNIEVGRGTFLAFAPGGAIGETAGPAITIVPCVIPAPGSRAVPTVELVDRASGETLLMINPAVARMSAFDARR